MPENDLGLFAHLMRRAGFGTTRDELEEHAAKGYEAVVEDLLHPERFPEVEEDLLQRYYRSEGLNVYTGVWIYRMVNSQRPLQEKTALFFHHLFATALHKTQHTTIYKQIEMFRRVGLSDLRTILTELSKDPAMIFWLDNNENRKDEPNENFGRELLELFSMGVGNYTEQDLKMAARAFTGWTFTQPVPTYPHSYYPSYFEYREDDHDDGVKTFLGETGRFNGEDIIDIIVKQPATARFISRHLYNFFVADEPPVPCLERDPSAGPRGHRCPGEGLLRFGWRHALHTAGAVQLRLLQGGPVQEGQEPHGAGDGRHKAGGHLSVPHSRNHTLLGRDGPDGADAAEPADGGGMAHGPGVDRRRHPERASQLRRGRGGRRQQARH